MSTRKATVLLALVGLASAAVWLGLGLGLGLAPSPATTAQRPQPREAGAGTVDLTTNPVPALRVRKGTEPTRPGQQAVAVPDGLPPPWPESDFEPHEYALNKLVIFRNFQAASEDWTVETFAGKVAQVNDLNGRQAYEVYAYLRACHQQPRSVEQLERRTTRISGSERARHNMTEDQLEQYVASIERGLVRCEALPPDEELIPMMIGWLTLAAERGFPQAQLAYHKSIRWLLALDAWGVYRYPQQVEDYRRLAPLFLENALRSGHPDGFYEYSLALREAVVFAEDPQAAFAYAHAATLAAQDGHPEAEGVLQMLELVLTPRQQREARASGRELCNTWCRGG